MSALEISACGKFGSSFKTKSKNCNPSTILLTVTSEFDKLIKIWFKSDLSFWSIVLYASQYKLIGSWSFSFVTEIEWTPLFLE